MSRNATVPEAVEAALLICREPTYTTTAREMLIKLKLATLPWKSGCESALLRIRLLLILGLWLAWPACVWPQSVIATLPVGGSAVAVNKVTNRIYVAGGTSASVVTVIDGATRSTTVVPTGFVPVAVAVNETTNKIYVANIGRTYLFERQGKGSVTVIDGATNATATVIDPNAHGPCAIAVNSVTDKIYVANDLSSNVTVIDGATNATTTVTDPNASRLAAYALAVNPVSNKIYVANQNIAFPTGSDPGNITVIDGGTNATTTVTDPNAFAPTAVAVNTLTNRIYVANRGAYPAANHGNVTILDGATNSTSTVTDPNAVAPRALGVNQATNKVYVANANDLAGGGRGIVTVIDGASKSVITLMDSIAPLSDAVAVDEDTNRVYVADAGCVACGDPGSNPGGVTIIDGDTDSVTTLIDPKAIGPTAIGLNPVTNQIYVPNFYSQNLTVIGAGIAATTRVLEVMLPVTGIGTVTSNPSGINCGTVCAESFSVGASVSLTASASPGASFLGWSGACVGTGSCDVTMSSDQVVTATFNRVPTEVAVPNVVGLTQAEATRATSGAGLIVGTVSQQSSSTVPSGEVISENPVAGTELATGSPVDLVVSMGGGAGGDSTGSGGSGGGDALTPAALLSVLIVALRRRKAQILQ